MRNSIDARGRKLIAHMSLIDGVLKQTGQLRLGILSISFLMRLLRDSSAPPTATSTDRELGCSIGSNSSRPWTMAIFVLVFFFGGDRYSL